jgi:uncharacterized protein YbaR (Trm112 family)
MITKCPICRGQLQLTETQEVYWSLVDGVWVRKLDGMASIDHRIYCENDHELDDLVLGQDIPDTGFQE